MLAAWRERLLPEAPQWRFLTGLALLSSGILLGIAGVAIFLLGEPRIAGGLEWREAAITLAALSPPLILGGILVALPGRAPLRALGAAGAAVMLWGTGLFVRHYPHNFNVASRGLEDHAPTVATVYAVGTALMAVTLLVQIVAMALRRSGTDEEGLLWEDTYKVSDRMVERDIEDAMQRYGVQWGSAPKRADGVEIVVPGFGTGAVVRGQSAARRVRLEMPAVDAGSQRLRDLSGPAVQVETHGIDDASTVLGALHKDRLEHPRRYRPPRRAWWKALWTR